MCLINSAVKGIEPFRIETNNGLLPLYFVSIHLAAFLHAATICLWSKRIFSKCGSILAIILISYYNKYYKKL
jgi:hypothetical protein